MLGALRAAAPSLPAFPDARATGWLAALLATRPLPLVSSKCHGLDELQGFMTRVSSRRLETYDVFQNVSAAELATLFGAAALRPRAQRCARSQRLTHGRRPLGARARRPRHTPAHRARAQQPPSPPSSPASAGKKIAAAAAAAVVESPPSPILGGHDVPGLAGQSPNLRQSGLCERTS